MRASWTGRLLDETLNDNLKLIEHCIYPSRAIGMVVAYLKTLGDDKPLLNRGVKVSTKVKAGVFCQRAIHMKFFAERHPDADPAKLQFLPNSVSSIVHHIATTACLPSAKFEKKYYGRPHSNVAVHRLRRGGKGFGEAKKERLRSNIEKACSAVAVPLATDDN